jgi:predicted outer membrane protein
LAVVAQEALVAQETPQPRRPAGEVPALQPLQGTPPAAASASDQQIAALIFGACHNEVELAKFAQSKLQSEQARAFAEKMVREHTPDCEAYAKWAGNLAAAYKDPVRDAADPAAAPRPAALPRPADPPAAGAAPLPRAATELPRAAADPPAAGATPLPRPTADGAAAIPPAGARVELNIANRAAGQPDWVTIHRQFGEQCLSTAKQELGRKQGAEFDHCFFGQQFMGHLKMADELKVLRQHASPQLQAQIDKSAQVVQSHLQELRQIMETMKDPPARVSRKPEGNK